MSHADDNEIVVWSVEPEFHNPAQVPANIRKPTGYLDFWELYTRFGKLLHPEFWNPQVFDVGMGEKLEVYDEFRLASQFHEPEEVSDEVALACIEIQEFPGWKRKNPITDLEQMRQRIWEDRVRTANETNPPALRYREVRDRIFHALLEEKITVKGFTPEGKPVEIYPDAWRGQYAEKAAVSGKAHIDDGYFSSRSPANQNGRFCYLLVIVSALEVLRAQSNASSIDINQKCENFLLSLISNSPMKETRLKELIPLAKKEGVYPSVRAFRGIYQKVIRSVEDNLGRKIPWGKRGKKKKYY